MSDAEKLTRLLYLAHMNRRQVAKLLGIHRITMIRYCTGAYEVPQAVMWALRGILTVSRDDTLISGKK